MLTFRWRVMRCTLLHFAALFFLLGTSTPLLAQYPQPHYVGIPTAVFNYDAALQKKSEWCWAASIQMILNYYGIPVTQPQIVTRAYGAPVNLPGTGAAIYKNLNGWAIDANGQQRVVRSVEVPGAPTDVQLFAQLRNKHPILLTFSTGPYTGHAVVITGASFIGPVVSSLIIRDPWPSTTNITQDGRVEITQPYLAQFATRIRSYWIVTASGTANPHGADDAYPAPAAPGAEPAEANMVTGSGEHHLVGGVIDDSAADAFLRVNKEFSFDTRASHPYCYYTITVRNAGSQTLRVSVLVHIDLVDRETNDVKARHWSVKEKVFNLKHHKTKVLKGKIKWTATASLMPRFGADVSAEFK